MARADRLRALSDGLTTLQREWNSLTTNLPLQTEKLQSKVAKRRDLGRIRTGLRTPEGTYRQPILQALVDLGGSARTGRVLDRVEALMKGVLNGVDYALLPSDQLPRWRKAAQFARLGMVKDGLLKKDSPAGLWEITEVGRQTLVALRVPTGSTR